jgi:TRAP-type mannitol/chloroaromatic compound transport system permease small subunit
MRAIAGTIDWINVTIGKLVAWLALAIVLVQLLVVLGRYVFGIGSIQAQESITYMHGMLFMLAAAYTLKADGHVRIDIIYRGARPRTKAMVNLFGSLFFLIPMCAVIFLVSRNYVAQSWAVHEGSRETSGLQAVFLLKTVIPIFAVQMALQGVSIVIHALLALGGDERELSALEFGAE